MTICKHIVEHHRGRVWVESEEGKGSTFFFVLRKRIVVEDDQLVLDFLSLPKKDKGRASPKGPDWNVSGADRFST